MRYTQKCNIIQVHAVRKEFITVWLIGHWTK